MEVAEFSISSRYLMRDAAADSLSSLVFIKDMEVTSSA
jgi:hypothetical protein